MNLSYTIYCAIQGCKDKKRLKMIESNKKHYQEKVAELQQQKNDKINQDPDDEPALAAFDLMEADIEEMDCEELLGFHGHLGLD